MKKFIRNFLNKRGYEIVKTGLPYIPKSNKPGTVKVGKYDITMPGNNPQLINYKLYDNLNAQLGRLVSLIYQKYPGMTVIDVGANVGDTIAIIKTYADVPVIGIEGDDTSYQYLENNSKQFKNVSLVKTFLGEKNQHVNVSFESSGWNTTLKPGAESGEKIELRPLDDVIAKDGFGSSDIKLLKVDVEGFDTIVLRGASDIISKTQPVLFFEYNRQIMKGIEEEGLSTVLSFVKYGYDKIIFFDHKGNLVLCTTLQNEDIITHLHNYISSSNNLMGYYDIAIFHNGDKDIADRFFKGEQEYL